MKALPARISAAEKVFEDVEADLMGTQAVEISGLSGPSP
jgi:hypothetical protein